MLSLHPLQFYQGKRFEHKIKTDQDIASFCSHTAETGEKLRQEHFFLFS